MARWMFGNRSCRKGLPHTQWFILYTKFCFQGGARVYRKHGGFPAIWHCHCGAHLWQLSGAPEADWGSRLGLYPAALGLPHSKPSITAQQCSVYPFVSYPCIHQQQLMLCFYIVEAITPQLSAYCLLAWHPGDGWAKRLGTVVESNNVDYRFSAAALDLRWARKASMTTKMRAKWQSVFKERSCALPAGAQDCHVLDQLANFEMDRLSSFFQGGSGALLVRSQGSCGPLTCPLYPAGWPDCWREVSHAHLLLYGLRHLPHDRAAGRHHGTPAAGTPPLHKQRHQLDW